MPVGAGMAAIGRRELIGRQHLEGTDATIMIAVKATIGGGLAVSCRCLGRHRG